MSVAGRTRALAIVAVAGALAVGGVVGTAHLVNNQSADTAATVTTTVDVSQPAVATQQTPSRSALPSVSATPKVSDPAEAPITLERPLLRAKCVLPDWRTGEDEFLEAALVCLNDAWRPLLESLKVNFTPPALTLTSSGRECRRTVEESSNYCDGTIYLNRDSYARTAAGPSAVAIAALAMLSHEYGHHVQQLSGTLPAAIARIDAAGAGSPEGLELTRRTELQAQCLAGMFFGVTFDEVTVDVAERDSYTRGDEPKQPGDHGTPTHFGGWFAIGAQLNSLAVCNTWVAAPDAVS